MASFNKELFFIVDHADNEWEVTRAISNILLGAERFPWQWNFYALVYCHHFDNISIKVVLWFQLVKGAFIY